MLHFSAIFLPAVWGTINKAMWERAKTKKPIIIRSYQKTPYLTSAVVTSYSDNNIRQHRDKSTVDGDAF
jgi:hypothetical protein